jgi:hypothetical protein
MQENDAKALTMVLGFQKCFKILRQLMTTPHTSDLQTGLTPQNHNSQGSQDSQVAVFCVLQSASPHRCSKRRAAPRPGAPLAQ